MNPTGTIKKFGYTSNLAQSLNSSVTIENDLGYSTCAVRVTAPTGGVVIFEGSIDGINWESLNFRSISHDIFMSNSNNDSDFIGSIIGMRFIRFRVSSAGSTAGTVMGVLTKEVSILESIEFGYPPHRFGYTPVHKDASFTDAQTATAIWTPTSGKKYIVTDCLITASGTTDGTIKIFDNTDLSGGYLYKGYVNVSTIGTTVISIPLRTPFISSAVDNVLKFTSSANIDVDIILSGYEI